jgi:hypothetical protein
MTGCPSGIAPHANYKREPSSLQATTGVEGFVIGGAINATPTPLCSPMTKQEIKGIQKRPQIS